ncbi:aminoglycoside phosphotransferase family protein [Vibrio sp. Of7-15]|uniref:phosphotransferase enzyme family protein n=1 Tax=Vibrio sp. Of7-15 TaxID=2724879 RepID=UPI001EF34789|nr:aminoglycoside phosphotransferase family protein [Vibrio sp. Of7-15]MCG7500194.1 aminoglycoside phosphotransferase family protein [Vibrio sp. Of7-15]
MEELKGGREGAVYRDGNKLYRPKGKWSGAVHALLSHLRVVGFYAAPQPFGFEKEQEVLSFVQGNVFNYPLNGDIATVDTLISAAQLLRRYHDATQSFLVHLNQFENQWMLPAREPQEVVCHGDFAPYNVALKNKKVVGVFDFDTAHPAPRVWDIAYALYCWAPFKTDKIDAYGDLDQQLSRAKLFCDSYGVSDDERAQLPYVMVERIRALVQFVEKEARNGNEAFQSNMNDGHHFAYLNDICYLIEHQQKITAALCHTR